jgi:DNA-binding winged helix-turn-helix (wHTH) protein
VGRLWPVPFRFEDYELDLERFELRRSGRAVALEPQVFDVLAYLVRHRNRVVSKTDLLDDVWGDRFVSESALTSRIKAARRAIGDDGSAQRAIRTVHGRGYRFMLEVEEGPGPPPAPTVPPRPVEQRIQFCTTADGVRLACATVGAGPPLVKVANWLSHLDFDWESPVWRHWWRDLSAHHRLIRYDERGCGLSDWDVDQFSLSVPTLVLHARGDARCPLDAGRKLAALIPCSRFVTLDSPNHLLQGDEPAWARFLQEVEGFLAEVE